MTEALKKPVRAAQRRLWLNRWLIALGWSLTGAAIVFLLAVLIDRLWLAPENAARFYGIIAGAAAGSALLASLIWLLFTKEDAASAAARLDVAAGLKERISTGIYCQSIEDPFAKAVVVDAERTIRGLNVRHHLPIDVPTSAGYAGGTLVVAMLFFWLFPAVDLSGKQQLREEENRKKEEIKKVEVLIKPAVDQQMRKLADKNPLLKKELEDLEAMKEARIDTPLNVRQDALKKVEKLSDKLEEKKNSERLAQAEEFKKMLRRLGDDQKKDSPVSSLSKALSKGDFKTAQDALDQIKKELEKTPSTPQEQARAEELKSQLDQLSKKLEQLAKENKATQDQLAKAGLSQEEIKKALENLQKNDIEAVKQQLAQKGLTQEKMEQMMQQMKKNAAACSACNSLGQKLAQGAAAGGQGQLSQAGQQGLTAAGEQLSQMEALQQELNQLSSSMADLNAMKDSLGKGCSACNGTGMLNGAACAACNGSGMGNMGQGGDPSKRGGGMGKLGQGEGGAAPEQATDFKTVQKRSPINTLPGRIISQEFIDGEQFKGDVSPAYTEAALTAEREATDAIAREQIPRSIQGSVSKYFTRTFGDVPKDKAAEPAEEKPADN